MVDYPKLTRTDMEALIGELRGDVIQLLISTASDQEIEQYFQSLQRSAELLGEPIPGAEAEDDDASEAGEADADPEAAAAPPAAAPPSSQDARPQETRTAASGPPPEQPSAASAPAAQPVPKPSAEDEAEALRALKIEAINLLKALANDVKTANAQQLTGLRIALKLARGKMQSLKGDG